MPPVLTSLCNRTHVQMRAVMDTYAVTTSTKVQLVSSASFDFSKQGRTAIRIIIAIFAKNENESERESSM